MGEQQMGNLGCSYYFVEGLQEVYLICQCIHLGPLIHLVHLGSIHIVKW